MENLLYIDNNLELLDKDILSKKIKKLLLICCKSIKYMELNDYFMGMKKRIGVEVVKFSEFEANPKLENVIAAIEKYKEEQCDAIIAVGGGSAIDVGKCVRICNKFDNEKKNFDKNTEFANQQLYVIPTTAGSGSEATKYAVIYKNGNKMSISDKDCMPNVVCFDSSTLNTLPEYHKKSSLLDALCQAIESIWSVNVSEESINYAVVAIKLIIANYKQYLEGNSNVNKDIQKAAYLSGKAINITQTTAGHAMSYKLTNLCGIAHGHAVALCISKIWPYMYKKSNEFCDVENSRLNKAFNIIANAMECASIKDSIIKFNEIFSAMELKIPTIDKEGFDVLVSSVNKERLKNNPIIFTSEEINYLYRVILEV